MEVIDNKILAKEFIDITLKMFKTGEQEQIGKFTKGELFILDYLCDKDETGVVVLPTELSTAMGASTARVAAILNSLEAKGLIVRLKDKDDKRKVHTKITEHGKKTVLEQRKIVRKCIEEMIKELGTFDTNEYIRISSRIIDIFNKNRKGSSQNAEN